MQVSNTFDEHGNMLAVLAVNKHMAMTMEMMMMMMKMMMVMVMMMMMMRRQEEDLTGNDEY